jgi:hypothetical protein
MRKKQEFEQLQQEYIRTFRSEAGKIVLKDLMRRFNVFRTTYVEGDRDAMLLNEGMRNVILHILEFINMTPAEIERMYVEIRDNQLKWSINDAENS